MAIAAAPSLHFQGHVTERSEILSWLSNTSSPSPRLRKRALADRDRNIMTDRQQSPSKRRKILETPESPGKIDDTPRVSRSGQPGATQLPDVQLRSPATGSLSSRSTRSHSPVKKMADMMLNPEPILLKQFDEPQGAVIPELEEMLSGIQRISRGLGVISDSYRVSAADQ